MIWGVSYSHAENLFPHRWRLSDGYNGSSQLQSTSISISPGCSHFSRTRIICPFWEKGQTTHARFSHSGTDLFHLVVHIYSTYITKNLCFPLPFRMVSHFLGCGLHHEIVQIWYLKLVVKIFRPSFLGLLLRRASICDQILCYYGVQLYNLLWNTVQIIETIMCFTVRTTVSVPAPHTFTFFCPTVLVYKSLASNSFSWPQLFFLWHLLLLLHCPLYSSYRNEYTHPQSG